MKKSILLFLVGISLLACDLPQHSYSDLKTESGVVVAKAYEAEINGDVTTVNVDMNMNLGIGMGTVHSPEKFSVVFKCEHGEIFTINNKEVYARVSTDETVTIVYREKLRTHKGNTKVVDFDFIGIE